MTDKGGKLRGSALQGEDRDREGGNDNVLSPLSVSGASSDAKKASGSHRVHDNAEKERPRTQKLEDRGRASGDTTSPSVAAGAGSGPSDPGAQEGIPIRNKRKHEDDSGGSMKVAAVGQDRANPASKDASPAGLSGGLSRDASADAIIRAAIESGEPLIPFLELIGSPGRSAESTDVVQKLEQAVQRATARGITEEEKAVFRSYIQLQERRALANRLESQASRAAQLLESLRRALSEKALANKTDGQEGKAGAGLGGESEEGKEGGESKGGGKGQEGGQPGGL